MRLDWNFPRLVTLCQQPWCDTELIQGEQVAVIGPESLGAELALLFAEDGVNVFLLAGEKGVEEVMDRATKRRCAARLTRCGGTYALLIGFYEPLPILTS
jgi:hypothetical protein